MVGARPPTWCKRMESLFLQLRQRTHGNLAMSKRSLKARRELPAVTSRAPPHRTRHMHEECTRPNGAEYTRRGIGAAARRLVLTARQGAHASKTQQSNGRGALTLFVPHHLRREHPRTARHLHCPLRCCCHSPVPKSRHKAKAASNRAGCVQQAQGPSTPEPRAQSATAQQRSALHGWHAASWPRAG